VKSLSVKMNTKLLQILQRQDFDRPILMHDKLDLIWDKSTSQIVNQKEVRNKLKQRKFDRVVLNNKQAKIYD
jgi:hypothetical protein